MANTLDATSALLRIREEDDGQVQQQPQQATDATSALLNIRAEAGQQPAVQSQGSGAVTGSFGQVLPQVGESNRGFFADSPLNLVQQGMMGLIINDDLRVKYLQEEFGDANVSLSGDDNILVNGKRIDPAGFGLTNIIQGAGIALPIAGQVVGGAFGGLPGGILGGTLGEAARIGAGKLGGAETPGGAVAGALGTEAGLSAIGEVGGRVLGAAGKGISKSAPIKAISKAYRRAFGMLEKADPHKNLIPPVAKFVTGLNEDIVKAFPENGGWRELTKEINLNPERIFKLSDDFLFGTKFAPVDNKVATEALLNSFKSKNAQLVAKGTSNGELKGVFSTLTGLTEEELEQTLKYNAGSLSFQNSENVLASQSVGLVRKITGAFEDTISKLGAKMRGIEESFPKTILKSGQRPERLKRTIDIEKMLSESFEELKDVGVGSGGRAVFQEDTLVKAGVQNISADFAKVNSIIRKEFTPTDPQIQSAIKRIKVNLKKELPVFVDAIELERLAQKRLKDAISKGGFFKKVTVGDGIKVRRNLDAHLTSMVKQNASSDNSTRIFGNFMSKFRNAIKDSVDDTGAYREVTEQMHKLLTSAEGVKLESVNFEAAADRLIRSGKIQDALQFEKFTNLFGEIDNASRLANAKPFNKKVILDSIDKHSLARRVNDVNALDNGARSKLLTQVNNNDIVTAATDNVFEKRLSTLSNQLMKEEKINGQKVFTNNFVSDAKKAVIGQHIVGGSPNLLRTQTVANMTSRLLGGAIFGGGGAAVGSVLGPFGAGAGAVAGLALTQPKIFAKTIALLEKKHAAQSAKQAAKQFGGFARNALKGGKSTITDPNVISALARLMKANR